MTKEELMNILHKSEKDLEILKTNVTVDGETYSVYLTGTDEMWELNEFYQIGHDIKTGKAYRFYYSTTDENGNPIELDDIDYKNAYRMEPAEEEEY